jgi:hypothetical protein
MFFTALYFCGPYQLTSAQLWRTGLSSLPLSWPPPPPRCSTLSPPKLLLLPTPHSFPPHRRLSAQLRHSATAAQLTLVANRPCPIATGPTAMTIGPLPPSLLAVTSAVSPEVRPTSSLLWDPAMWLGKLIQAPAVTLTVYPQSPTGAAKPSRRCPACLLYLTYELTNTPYLVDTGAALSLIPFSSTSPPSGPTIVNANGKPTPSWNFISQNVHFHNIQFYHSFLQAKVTQPILVFDFLNANGEMKWNEKYLFPTFTVYRNDKLLRSIQQ